MWKMPSICERSRISPFTSLREMDTFADDGSISWNQFVPKIFACHGHKHGVKNDLHRLYYAGLEKSAHDSLWPYSPTLMLKMMVVC